MRKVLVVGNGPSALTGGQGRRIDSAFDEVVRFNNYVTRGHERHVGSRCDTWAHSLCKVKPRDISQFTRVVIDVPWVVGRVTSRAHQAGLLHWQAVGERVGTEVIGLPDSSWTEVSEAMFPNGRNGRMPSSGAALLWHYAHHESCDVTAHGFDGMVGGHYYGGGGTSWHSPQAERALLQRLVCEGKVRLLSA